MKLNQTIVKYPELNISILIFLNLLLCDHGYEAAKWIRLTNGDVRIKPAREYADSKDLLWPTSTIPIYIPTSIFTPPEINVIYQGISLITGKTCMKFINRTTETAYVEFKKDKPGCWATLEPHGKVEIINLGKGCHYPGAIAHEIMHILGFLHEQMRYDRDDYVEIVWKNIPEDYIDNYARLKSNNQAFPYDYNSILHYDADSFEKNGVKTIIAKNRNIKISPSNVLSKLDVLKINTLYNCDPKIYPIHTYMKIRS